MGKKSESNSYRCLVQLLNDKHFQKRFSLSKSATLDLLRKDNWREKCNKLDSYNKDLDCQSILSQCTKTLKRFCEAPNEGWLRFTYRYAINLSYPDSKHDLGTIKEQDGALFFLAVLQAFYQTAHRRGLIDERLDLFFLDERDIEESEYKDEYHSAFTYFKKVFVYEMMRLAQEITPYTILEHIAGVHNLALNIGRQMKEADTPVDLPLLSAASFLHDIGKFGCKNGERVPYLHYYYTDQWCKAANAPNIGHIAANHSAWDLELENLSVESLLLIYADFRVKQTIDASGIEHTEISSLSDSFDVILQKLDNVDEAKRYRYSFVYSKLKDFEDYMFSLGVDLHDGRGNQPAISTDIALMSHQQVLEAFKFMGIEHNIALMHRLGTERLFGNILESARSEKDWKNLRAYIDILEEYFTYLGANQKIQTLSFLYELLTHSEGDIRRAAADLIGKIIAHFDDGYRKEIPAGVLAEDDNPTSMQMWSKYVHDILIPDHILTDQHKSWMGYSLKIMVASVINNCPKTERKEYLAEIWQYFSFYDELDNWTSFVLLDTIYYLPLDLCGDKDLSSLYNFAVDAYHRQPVQLHTASLRVLQKIAEQKKDSAVFQKMLRRFIADMYDDEQPTMIYLKSVLMELAGIDDTAEQTMLFNNEIVSDIFLDNLKMATPWITKSINISLLLNQVERGHTDQLLHIAAHFSNLLKVSERVVVRHDAGTALIHIAHLLEPDQRNEIATELTKGLEVGEYAFSKYIPIYLGEFALWLKPQELDELISRLEVLLSSPSDNIVEVALDTVGILLQCYSDYQERFPEDSAVYEAREHRLLGMLLKGLSSYRLAVRQEALLVIGKDLFASERMSHQDKCRLFALCHKKLLFLISENLEGDLGFFYRAAALNHIYRFIALETLNNGGFTFEEHDRLAFFPGTFDPFTLSHKGIVQEICNMDFEMMLAIDEFSWSKNVQPRKIRRQIAIMSLAGDFNVHIFPDSIPINIANPEDLKRLHELFPDKKLYIVVGSDVILHASSYKAPAEPYSIHHANHIVFSRSRYAEDPRELRAGAFDCIDGDIINLSLPTNLEDISSTRIRENIDRNRDISNLIDKSAQEYIYHNSLYLREPQYKPILKAKDISFELVNKPDPAFILELLVGTHYNTKEANIIAESIGKYQDQVIIIRNGSRQDVIEGFIAFRELATSDLLNELHEVELAEAVRQRAAGRMMLISGIYTREGGISDPEQLLLTEALDIALRQNCTYAIFHQPSQIHPEYAVTGVLKRQGFIDIAPRTSKETIYLTDMRAPVALIQNLETAIKEPLASNDKVLEAISTAHKRLQTALTGLYPGNLILSMSTGVIHHRLINKITTLNKVPAIPLKPRQLGPYMCVPFGKILRGRVLPNTVTKTLHTDKVYEPDVQNWHIEAYPYYASLEDQIRTIKSFRRPVILVDDMLHTADRLSTLNPMFEEQGIEVVKVLVGLMSGRGKDLITKMNREADSIYYIPNMRGWFVESSIYPFIGGDTVRREKRQVANLLPSVNLILPYAAPPITDYSSKQAVFNLSLTCLNNARNILLALESEYLYLFGRNLTLNRLSEAIILPQCPDKGECIHYDPALTASIYLENEIEMLLRTRSMIV